MSKMIPPYTEPPAREVKLPDANDLSFDDRLTANSITRLMRIMGEKLAPKELRNHEKIGPILEELGLKGTNNEVLVARLFAQVMYNGDVNAAKLIYEIQEGKMSKTPSQFIINFIAPSEQSVKQDEQNLESDSWVLPSEIPGESKAAE